MSTNYKATMGKRQRELDQKDRVVEREARRAARKARAEHRAATGQVGPKIGEPIAPLGATDVDVAAAFGVAPRPAAEGPGPQREGANRLYVGNLSFNTTLEQIRELFADHGMVTDVHVAMDRESGRPRGFAFVTMSTAAEARKATEALNGEIVDGRPLRVNEAEERDSRGGGGGRGGFRGGGGGRR